MPHVLIVGQTLSGKTKLAQTLSREYQRKGIQTLVLDPLDDPAWHANYQSRNVDEFSDVVRTSQRCAVFVDESGEVIGRYDDTLTWLATRARHYGHKSHFLTQRPAQLNKTVRDQCEHIFIFKVSRKDAQLLSEEFVTPELAEAHTLPKLHFMWVSRFGEVKRGYIRFVQGLPVPHFVDLLTKDASHGSDTTASGRGSTPRWSGARAPEAETE